MKGTLSLIAGAHAAVALATLMAVRGLSRSLDTIDRYGGIGSIDFWGAAAEAARWPIIATWIAVGASLVALTMLRGDAPQERPMRTATLAAIAIGAGLAAVLVFRASATFIAYGMLPPGQAVGRVITRLTSASAVTAICFAAAAVIAVTMLRTRVAKSVAVLAVVLSLGMSAAMLVTLRDMTARFEHVAQGGQPR
jgi:hypothetical protein